MPPDALFDPEVEGPPADAFDVQFRLPLSMDAYVTHLLEERRHHELTAVQALFDELTNELVERFQFFCGHVGPIGLLDHEARLAITPISEPTVPGVAGLRPHVHLYVGATAHRVHVEEVGVVDEAQLRQGVFGGVYSFWINRVRERSADRFGFAWARSHGGVTEIVDPPYAQLVPRMQRVVCPGHWGPRRLVLADESALLGAAESERLIAHQRAIGMPGAS